MVLPKVGGEKTMTASLIGIPGLHRTSSSFRQRLIEAADEIGTEPDFLATVIAFESGGTFSSSVRNPTSGCVGLIQFCAPAAKPAAADAGLSMPGKDAQDWLSEMSPEEQLKYVVSYFLRMSGGRRPLTLDQTYLLIFAPSFALREPSAVAYSEGTSAYAQNRPMDTDNDGKITVADIASKIRGFYQKNLSNPRVMVTVFADDGNFAAAGVSASSGLAVAAAGIAIGWYWVSDWARKKLT